MYTTSKTYKPYSNAFTLIELLVVISIISLLISILLPALASARKAAQATLCSNQIKQIHMAMVVYAGDDSKRRMPNAYGDNTTPRRNHWFNLLYPYLQGSGGLTSTPTLYSYTGRRDMAYRCPSSTDDQGWWAGTADWGVGTYLYNTKLGPGHSAVVYPSMDHVIMPSLTFVFTDSITSYAASNPSQLQSRVSSRHPGQTFNIFYVDGHGTRATLLDDQIQLATSHFYFPQ